MSKRPKIKVTAKKGKPKGMARGGVLKADPKKGVPGAIVNPLEKSHGKTVKFIGGMRAAKNKMPPPFKDMFPNF